MHGGGGPISNEIVSFWPPRGGPFQLQTAHFGALTSQNVSGSRIPCLEVGKPGIRDPDTFCTVSAPK